MSHTPGPWTIDGPSKGMLRNIDDGGDYALLHNGHIIAEAFRVVGENVTAPAEANARLIAAAPDLLEALKLILDGQDEFASANYLSELAKKARAAIAKAEGK